ncbi:hypothetical protein EMIT0P218_80189 [Pseudomonas sp. IT-P218]
MAFRFPAGLLSTPLVPAPLVSTPLVPAPIVSMIVPVPVVMGQQ